MKKLFCVILAGCIAVAPCAVFAEEADDASVEAVIEEESAEAAVNYFGAFSEVLKSKIDMADLEDRAEQYLQEARQSGTAIVGGAGTVLGNVGETMAYLNLRLRDRFADGFSLISENLFSALSSENAAQWFSNLGNNISGMFEPGKSGVQDFLGTAEEKLSDRSEELKDDMDTLVEEAANLIAGLFGSADDEEEIETEEETAAE